jgi:hypothetical protein
VLVDEVHLLLVIHTQPTVAIQHFQLLLQQVAVKVEQISMLHPLLVVQVVAVLLIKAAVAELLAVTMVVADTALVICTTAAAVVVLALLVALEVCLEMTVQVEQVEQGLHHQLAVHQ